MPTISIFFGVTFRTYYDDHAPPHLRAYYGGDSAVVEIETLNVTGRLPRRAIAMVFEWAAEHREELLVNWERAAAHQPLMQIAPLE